MRAPAYDLRRRIASSRAFLTLSRSRGFGRPLNTYGVVDAIAEAVREDGVIHESVAAVSRECVAALW